MGEISFIFVCVTDRKSSVVTFVFFFSRLGLAYAGSNRQDVLSLILPVLADPKSNLEVRIFSFTFIAGRDRLQNNHTVFQVIGMAAIACGLVAIGTCNGDVTSTILQTMMERSEAEVKETNSRNLALGLGLTFLGKMHV